MSGDHFSLCWNNFHNNLSNGFHSLLQSEDLVDVTLAAEGKYLKAHKIVLSVCSPYFKELFRVNPCKHPIVILKDISYRALRDLLQFMYQGEVSVSQDELNTFMKVAETLQIKGLTEETIVNIILEILFLLYRYIYIFRMKMLIKTVFARRRSSNRFDLNKNHH